MIIVDLKNEATGEFETAYSLKAAKAFLKANPGWRGFPLKVYANGDAVVLPEISLKSCNRPNVAGARTCNSY